MEYRKLPHGEEQISVIGMGSSVVGEQKEKDIIQTVQVALEQGVNFFDMAGGHSAIFRPTERPCRDSGTKRCCRYISGRTTLPGNMDGRPAWRR